MNRHNRLGLVIGLLMVALFAGGCSRIRVALPEARSADSTPVAVTPVNPVEEAPRATSVPAMPTAYVPTAAAVAPSPEAVSRPEQASPEGASVPGSLATPVRVAPKATSVPAPLGLRASVAPKVAPLPKTAVPKMAVPAVTGLPKAHVAPALPVAASSEALRILTYNVCAFPEAAQANFTKTFVCNGEPLALDDKAEYIAEGIRRAAPDVAVINEAWDEGFRSELADQLEGDYPYRVTTVDGFPLKVEDSGLMLFSRLPFLPLREECQGGVTGVAVEAAPSSGLDAVYAETFDDSAGDDANAWKSVAIARLKLGNGSAYVVFTHLQADDEYAWVRRRQLQQVQDVVQTCGPAGSEMASAPVFFVGDLNIPGRLSVSGSTVSAQAEWESLFRSAYYGLDYFSRSETGGPAGSFLADSYFWFGSPRGLDVSEIDPGATQGIRFSESADKISAPCGGDTACEGQRYDYAFQGPYRPYRLERVRLAWEANLPQDAGGWCNLSDHQPLVVDFFRYFAANQSVRTAAPLTFGSGDKVKTASGALPSARAMLWYRLEGMFAGGLYGILVSDGANYQVFAQNDLSRAMAPYPGSSGPRVGPKYYLPNPPYFIRVYPEEGQAPVQFTLHVTRIDCSSPDASCPLFAGMKAGYEWPATLVNGQVVWGDYMWFSFLTNESSLQELPKVELAFEPAAGVCPGNANCAYSLSHNTTRWAMDILPAPQSSPLAEIDDKRREGGAMVLTTSRLKGGANGALKEYLLRISKVQDPPANANRSVQVEYRTPLTYLFIGSLSCNEEWTGLGGAVYDVTMLPGALGNDDVFARFFVDSSTCCENMPAAYPAPASVPDGWTYWGSFYDQTAASAWPGENSLCFLSSVYAALVEWGPPGSAANPNDRYSTSDSDVFLALGLGEADRWQSVGWVSDDYDYALMDSLVSRLPLGCLWGAEGDANDEGYLDTCPVEQVPLP